MSIRMRSALLVPCALWGLLGIVPSSVALPREQFLIADSMPIVSRGNAASISFTASRVFTSIVKHVTFYAPDGMVITGIGPGKTGAMPVCQVANALPSNYVTCVAKLPGYAYYPFAPMHSIDLKFAIDPTSNVGPLTGTARLEQRYDGVHDTSFGANVQIDFIIEKKNLPLAPGARSLAAVDGRAFMSSFDATFADWKARAVALDPLPATPLPSNATTTTQVQGTSGEQGGRYAAVGKIVVYDAASPSPGAPDLRQGECSGVVVPSNGKNIVMTAAHCLLKIDPATRQASWRKQLAFCPGMTGAAKTSSDRANDPQACPSDGVYLAKIDPATNLPKAHMNDTWSNILANAQRSDDMKIAQYDLAFVELEPNAVTGKTVEQAHGSHGILFNARRLIDATAVKSVGYNGGSRDLGVCDRGSVSTMAGILPGTPEKVHTLVRKDVTACRMDKGTSGGPWLLDDAPSEARSAKAPAGWVIGVNAVGTAPGTPQGNSPSPWTSAAGTTIDMQYTPVLRDWAADLYKAAAGILPAPYTPRAGS